MEDYNPTAKYVKRQEISKIIKDDMTDEEFEQAINELYKDE